MLQWQPIIISSQTEVDFRIAFVYVGGNADKQISGIYFTIEYCLKEYKGSNAYVLNEITCIMICDVGRIHILEFHVQWQHHQSIIQKYTFDVYVILTYIIMY